MCEERDCSGLSLETVAELDRYSATIIDGAGYELRGPAGETTASYRTVAAFALGPPDPRLLALGRREERKAISRSSTVESVVREVFDVLGRSGLDHTNKPLLSLEQEAADPNLRRKLVHGRIPYALRLEPDYSFKNVYRSLDRDDDILEHIAVAYLFDCFTPGRDRTRTSCLEVDDLREGFEMHSRKVREHVFEIPVDDSLVHFVVWPGLSSSTRAGERLRASHKLAETAAGLILDRPSDALRMREFHHPHLARYSNALQLAGFGRAYLA
jgi:hypothetical protein